MNPSERLKVLNQFINTETYLKGLLFRSAIEGSDVKVYFKGISKEQHERLRKNLDSTGCSHIQIINVDKKKKRKRK